MIIVNHLHKLLYAAISVSQSLGVVCWKSPCRLLWRTETSIYILLCAEFVFIELDIV